MSWTSGKEGHGDADPVDPFISVVLSVDNGVCGSSFSIVEAQFISPDYADDADIQKLLYINGLGIISSALDSLGTFF